MIEAKFGFKFRQLLGKFIQLLTTNWTRLDLLPATSRVAQYPSLPGLIHFEALQHMVLYLRSHIDVRCIPILASEEAPDPRVASITHVVLLKCATTTSPGLGDEPVDTPDEFDVNLGYGSYGNASS